MLCCVIYMESNTPRSTSFRSAKQVWDTLVITYKESSQVKRNKLSLLRCKNKLFTMDEGEDIHCMFGCFQTILNELGSLGKNFDNYDHIDKILRSLSRKWGPRVTTLRSLKNLDTMSLEELVRTLKVHEQDKGIKKGKSLALGGQKVKKASSTKESSSRPLSKSASKALSIDNSSNEEFEEESN